MRRRDFLRGLGAAAAGLCSGAIGAEALAEATTATTPDARAGDPSLNARINATAQGKLPVRPFGKTGVRSSILGLGAAHLHVGTEREAEAFVNEVLDRGVNYLDTASTYGGGKCEARMGPVLKTRRGEAFVATKILQRGYDAARREFAESLRRLQTSYVDLLQIHAVNSRDELDAVFSKDGSLRVAIEAKRNGQTRFIGITGHTRPDVIAAALDRFQFDSVLVPLGIADEHVGDFGAGVLPKARQQGIAIVAMKVLGDGRYKSRLGIARPLRYSLNLPVSTCIVGMKNKAELDEALQCAASPQPLSEAELTEARELARPLGTTEVLWWKRT